jgi:hypothetical protein
VSKWQDIPKEEIEIDGEDINICLEGDNFGNNHCVVKKADMLELLSPGWISVKDKLPVEQGRYLVYINLETFIASFDGVDYWSYQYFTNGIYPTHWMPLPGAPEDK